MKKFTDALDNDLNTSLALTAVFDVIKSDANARTKTALLEEFDKVLSLNLVDSARKLCQTKQEEIPDEVALLAARRAEARKAKDFALADKLRDEITALGYVIEETRKNKKITKR